MSSVSRFTRQVPVSTTYYSSAGLSAGNNCYEFIPSTSNSLGNYPPGHVALIATPTLTNTILRDMGKTIYAPIGSLTGDMGYFRQVQLLKTTLSATFGVQQGDAYSTFYIAVPMNGLLVGASSGAFPIAGGQM